MSPPTILRWNVRRDLVLVLDDLENHVVQGKSRVDDLPVALDEAATDELRLEVKVSGDLAPGDPHVRIPGLELELAS